MRRVTLFMSSTRTVVVTNNRREWISVHIDHICANPMNNMFMSSKYNMSDKHNLRLSKYKTTIWKKKYEISRCARNKMPIDFKLAVSFHDFKCGIIRGP